MDSQDPKFNIEYLVYMNMIAGNVMSFWASPGGFEDLSL